MCVDQRKSWSKNESSNRYVGDLNIVGQGKKH